MESESVQAGISILQECVIPNTIAYLLMVLENSIFFNQFCHYKFATRWSLPRMQIIFHNSYVLSELADCIHTFYNFNIFWVINKPLSQGFLNLILSYLAKGFCWWYNIFETYSVTCAHNYDEIWYWINRGIINNIMAKIKTRKGQITTLSKAIQLNTGGARKCRRRVSRSCSRDSGIRRVTLDTNKS